MKVSDILRHKLRRIVSLPPTATALEAAALIKSEWIGAVLVRDERGRLLGVLSERDLAVAVATRGATLLDNSVSELMRAGGPTASPDDPIRDVMRTMTHRRARHIPVLSGDKVIGVVSMGDILKARLAEKSQENAGLQDLARARSAA